MHMSARTVNIEYRYYHGFGLGYAFYKRYCICNAIPLYAHKNYIWRKGCAGFHSILKTVHIKGFYGICVFVVIKAQSNAVFPESRQIITSRNQSCIYSGFCKICGYRASRSADTYNKIFHCFQILSKIQRVNFRCF